MSSSASVDWISPSINKDLPNPGTSAIKQSATAVFADQYVWVEGYRVTTEEEQASSRIYVVSMEKVLEYSFRVAPLHRKG
jgi:hypothetical protein